MPERSVARIPSRAATWLLTAAVGWGALYAVLVLAMPTAIPGRALISDVAFAPFHPLAGAILWLAAGTGGDPRRRIGLRLLALSQVLGVVNTLLWVLSSAGYLALNAPSFQYVGIGMTVSSAAGIVYLVPRRGVAGGTAVVPLVDASLLALASLSVGWQFVGAPLLHSGLESASDFLWFAILTATDVFTALFALSAWAFASRLLRADSAFLLSLSFGMAAFLDVFIEIGTMKGTYQSGEPMDVAFAVTLVLLVVVGYLEHRPARESTVGEAQRAALVRALLPFAAAAAVIVPVIAQATNPVTGAVRFVPYALLVLFFALVQWRFLLLERAAEGALTARLAMERDLRLSQQFESLGRYAASVAHDFNNLLAALLAQVHLMRLVGAGEGVAREHLAEMEKTLGSGTTLNRRLLQMSRGGGMATEPVDLTRATRNMAITVRRLLPDNVYLAIDAAADPVVVPLRPGDADQLLLNLVVNARDALPRGGHITVRIRTVNGWAELEVIDDGDGIAPQVINRIFEPFFTTKGEHGGTGLGLATVQSIARQSGGSVDVTSSPGHGTRFMVRWPATADA